MAHGWSSCEQVGQHRGMRADDVDPWRGLSLVGPVTGGHRNEVWRGRLGDHPVAVRRSRRSPESLEWELDLIEHLHRHGLRTAPAIAADDGRRHAGGVVVQPWLDGRPPTSTDDWRAVVETLERLHSVTRDHRQRPGCLRTPELERSSSSLDADMTALPADVAADVLAAFALADAAPVAVVHGDPGPTNIRMAPDGRVGLLDFDESRVDAVWHDLSNLGVQVLPDDEHELALRLSDAWETANAWIVEPAYARARLASLRAGA